MAAPIGPGDWVECVDASFRYSDPDGDLALLRVGAVYQVEAVRIGPGLLLCGVPMVQRQRGYWADRFRPIYRRDATLITRLLEKLPADQEPVEA